MIQPQYGSFDRVTASHEHRSIGCLQHNRYPLLTPSVTEDRCRPITGARGLSRATGDNARVNTMWATHWLSHTAVLR